MKKIIEDRNKKAENGEWRIDNRGWKIENSRWIGEIEEKKCG